MGYESRIYVVEPLSDKYGNVIAMFDLCKMGYDLIRGKSFPDLFKIEQYENFSFYSDDGNTPIKKDPYGDTVKKAASNIEVIEWLNTYIRIEGGAENAWWRAVVFRDFLKSLERHEMCYELYHYGY